jgi:hypothetical protein
VRIASHTGVDLEIGDAPRAIGTSLPRTLGTDRKNVGNRSTFGLLPQPSGDSSFEVTNSAHSVNAL